MIFQGKRSIVLKVLQVVGFTGSLVLGSILGLALGETNNIVRLENFEDTPSLPTQILDVKGRLITEFYSDEKRDIIPIGEIPKHLIDALTTREDAEFFQHSGFSMWGTMRAAWLIVTGQDFQGGSTLTQQLAGNIKTDRTELSVTRKLEELWWAFQFERNLSKWEILEQYLNKMPFGHGTFGVEAASQYYFRHSARYLSVAESAMLAIQLVGYNVYSPIRNPEGARRIQTVILQNMVEKGLVTQTEVDESLAVYWDNYDWSRDNAETIYRAREDKAPYFSEYIRNLLDEKLMGAMDIYRDGYRVFTTLDLDMQTAADEVMAQGIQSVNNRYELNSSRQYREINNEFIPLLDLLSLSFNIGDIRVAGSQNRIEAQRYFMEDVLPVLGMLGIHYSLDEISTIAQRGYYNIRQQEKSNQVEGALIALDNENGHIRAMVGGSSFDSLNQFNRATQASIQPGSAFKPLYYSAAISSRDFTPGSLIYDEPVFFENEDGTPYVPLNYRGEWKGKVLLRDALAHSMNVPAVQILDTIGFDLAIERSSRLLGFRDPLEIATVFPRKYPLALGVIAISPIQMARAYMIFPNKGREQDPVSIIRIEDRNGQVISTPSLDAITARQSRPEEYEVMDEQTAYLMTDLLSSTVEYGTLRYSRNLVNGFDGIDMAGKTGTTQNWADAWAVGFSPYLTTAVWFGFDRRGQSLGLNNTGAGAAGPVWAQFMKRAHEGFEPKEFEAPPTGIVRTTIDMDNGLLATQQSSRTRSELFISGTEPTQTAQIYYAERADTRRKQIIAWQEQHPDEASLFTNLAVNLSLDPDAGLGDSGSEDLTLLDFDAEIDLSDLNLTGDPNASLLDNDNSDPLNLLDNEEPENSLESLLD